MAKGNMLLGYARGKVGSLVFSRRKGEQITRARNFAPANPRTNAQLAQRMKMYAPVKLYRQSMERFFKYAFSLKEKETIFNGFMRENISIAPWAARELAVAQAPVPFPARMSSGGLGGFTSRPSFADDISSLGVGQYSVGKANAGELDSAVAVCLTRGNEEFMTVGDLSSFILANFTEFAAGDLITFVGLSTDALSLENGNVLYNGEGGFVFKYTRFVVDVNSETTLESLGLMTSAGVAGSFVWLPIDADSEADCLGGCVIHTRNVGSKIDANNTQLVLNGVAADIYDVMRTDAYRAIAAASYKASPDAYLNPATANNE